MLRGIGPRFYVEAGFLIAVATVLAVERVRPVEIVVVMLVAYVAVFSIELVLARRRKPESRPAAVVAAATPVAPQPEDGVTSAIVAVRSAEPVEPVEIEIADEPEAKDEAPVVPPPLVAVPEPEPEPEPQIEMPEPEPEPVVIASFPQQPRAWNVWELDRLVRSRAGDDPLRDEEWSYLLVYLRDFASPEGVLPEDFDELVRESFGDLLEAAAAR